MLGVWYIVRLRIREQFVEDLVSSARRVIKGCIDGGFKCIDPPITVTRLLEEMNLGEYRLRRFWTDAQRIAGTTVKLYSRMGSEFIISVEVRQGSVYFNEELDIPVDFIDCKMHPESCTVIPRTYSLYIYLDGNIENTKYHINVIRLLVLLERSIPYTSYRLLDAILRMSKNDKNGYLELLNTLLMIFRNINLLKYILPFMPMSVKDILNLSPALRILNTLFGDNK